MTSYLSFDDETKTLLNKKSQSHDLVIDKNSIIKTISEEMISQLCYHNIDTNKNLWQEKTSK